LLLAIKFIPEDNSLILILDTFTFYIYKMNFLNNLIHNDYIFFPLYIGMIGSIGYAWWSESTRVFTNLNNISTSKSTSPVSSWPYNWTADRITDITPTQFNFNQANLLRLEREADFEARLQTLDRVQENTRTLIDKLTELKTILNPQNTSVDLLSKDQISNTIWPYMNTIDLGIHPLTHQANDIVSNVTAWPLVWPFI